MDDNILEIPLTYHKSLRADWFRHFIALLFSQGIREFIIKSSKKWDKQNRFLTIIKNILKNLKNVTKMRQIFDKLNGNLLIMEMIKSFDLKWLLKTFKSYFKPDNKKDFLSANLRFFIEFFKYFNINFIDLSYIDSEYYINLLKNRKYILQNNKVALSVSDAQPDLSHNKPDIIFLSLDKYDTDLKKLVQSKLKFNSSSVNIQDDNHKINILGEDYILDGFFSLVKNQSRNEFVFSGIRYNNNYYINTSLVDTKDKKKYNLPLLKYDWTTFNDLYISLDQDNKQSIITEEEWKTGKMPNKEYFHFSSFSNVILIYSKVKRYSKGLSLNIMSEKQSSSLSDYKSINPSDFSPNMLKDLYDIEKLSRSELIKNINIIDPTFKDNESLTLNKLKEIYLYKLNEQYYSYKLKSLSYDKKLKEQQEELLKKQREERTKS